MIERIQNHWYGYAKLAFIYAMVFQISFLFDAIWLNQTYKMLAYLFIASIAMRFLLDEYKEGLKLPLDLVLCFILGVLFSDKGQRYSDQELLTLGQKLLYTIGDSWQFYVIGGLVLLIARLVVYTVQTRAQFTRFFAIGLIGLLILDSFSPILLWTHIITLIFLFLVWHMFWHYEQVRKKNEDEFEVLMQSPLSIFTPVTMVVSIALIVALFMPFGPPWLEDPYALWKKSRGEEVPAFLGEKGFKANLPNERSKNSGYSRDSSVLGGGFNYNYEPVMEIVSPKKSYWRGETINYYNGEGWVDTIRNYDYEAVMPKLPFHDNKVAATTEEMDIRVKLLRSSPYPVLFHTSEPKVIKETVYTFTNSNDFGETDDGNWYFVGNEGKQQVIYDESKELPDIVVWEKDNTIAFNSSNGRINYPSAYTITSDVLTLDTERLVQVEAKLEDNVLHELYIALPDDLPQEVVELARLITSEASSDYERAKLIEDYLKQNYAYSNQPNDSRLISGEDDFVYQFLFELYEGYCDYFSTTMAVMAKSLGMPARWVKGFAPGVNLSEQYLQQIPLPFDESEQLRNSLNGGVFNVRNADAHSWVEIYFEDHGWIAFEPTPGFSFPHAFVSEDVQLNALRNNELLNEDEALLQNKAAAKFKYTVIVIIVGSLLLIAVTIVSWIKREAIAQRITQFRFRQVENNAKVVQKFNLFLRYCEKRGLNRGQAETVQQALLRWTHGSKEWQQNLNQLYHMFEQARYSAKQMDDEQVKLVTELIASLKKRWNY